MGDFPLMSSVPPSLVYAERSHKLPPVDSQLLLDEWNVLPGALNDACAEVSGVVVLDPLSFPFEDMPRHAWHQPITIAWPRGLDVDTAFTLLDEVILRKLTFFDRLIVESDSVWNQLRRTLGLAESQRIRPHSRSVADVIAAAVASHRMAEFADRELSTRGLDSLDPWTVRSCRNKGIHQIEDEALRSELQRLDSQRLIDGQLSVAHVGLGVGRLKGAFGQSGYSGFVHGAGVHQQTTSNFPDSEIFELGPGPTVTSRPERFDVVAITRTLSSLGAQQRLNLIRSAGQSLRVGGHLLLLESFVPRGGRRWMGVDELVTGLLTATGHGVVLDDVKTLSAPTSSIVDRALIVLSKIGVPTT